MKKILLFFFMVIGFVFVANVLEVSASSTFSVELRTYLDEVNENIPAPGLTGRSRGEKVSFNASGISEDYSFAYYIVNGIINENLPQNYQFTVRKDLSITAVYYPNGNTTPLEARHVVVFADSNGRVLDIEYVEDGLTVTDSEVVLPRLKPNSILATNPWATADGLVNTLTNITENRIYYLQYEYDQVLEYTLTVTNSPGSGLYDFNELVTLVADPSLGEQPFSHWADSNGYVLSIKNTYSFSMLGNRTVVAVYGAAPTVEPVVTMSNDLNLRLGYDSYMGQFELPSGYSLVEYGFIFSRSSDVLTLDSLGATIVPSNVHSGLTKEFLRSFPEDTFNSIRAYLIVMNQSSIEEVYYSENMSGAPTPSEQVIYQTGFESSEGFASGTNYQLSLERGPVNSTWSYYFGTPSTDLAITGSQSSQMRYYTTSGNENNFGYIYTNFNVNGITKVDFKATRTSSLNVSASYSIDNGNTWIGTELFELSSGTNNLTYNVNTSVATAIRFDLVANGAASSSKLIIDDVKFYSLTSLPLHEITYVSDTTTKEFLVEGSLILNSITKTGYTFDGWYYDELLSTPYTNEQIVESLSLYAKFTVNSYTLTFNSNGGSSVTTLNQEFGSTVIEPEDPTRLGYTFDGWYEDNTSFATPYVFSTMPDFNDTIFAKWLLNDKGRTILDAEEISLPTNIIEATTLTLPSLGSNGSTISWSSSHESIINSETGVVTLPEETTPVTLTATASLNSESTTREIEINVNAEDSPVSPVLLYSYNFLDGGSSSNNSYANTNLSTSVSYAADNPGGTSGTTPWIANYANLSLATGTRLGGKLVSTEFGDPSANIRTNFTFVQVITKVEILGGSTFGTAGNVGSVYLQISTDGISWTTIGTQTISSTISYDGLNIAAGNYVRIVVQLTASGTNSGLSFTGIKVTGYPS